MTRPATRQRTEKTLPALVSPPPPRNTHGDSLPKGLTPTRLAGLSAGPNLRQLRITHTPKRHSSGSTGLKLSISGYQLSSGGFPKKSRRISSQALKASRLSPCLLAITERSLIRSPYPTVDLTKESLARNSRKLTLSPLKEIVPTKPN